jgi:hypothetical protein
MPREAGHVEWANLATRMPKALHREIRLYCLKSDTAVMDFVAHAIAEKLARQGRHRRRPGAH